MARVYHTSFYCLIEIKLEGKRKQMKKQKRKSQGDKTEEPHPPNYFLKTQLPSCLLGESWEKTMGNDGIQWEDNAHN